MLNVKNYHKSSRKRNSRVVLNGAYEMRPTKAAGRTLMHDDCHSLPDRYGTAARGCGGLNDEGTLRLTWSVDDDSSRTISSAATRRRRRRLGLPGSTRAVWRGVVAWNNGRSRGGQRRTSGKASTSAARQHRAETTTSSHATTGQREVAGEQHWYLPCDITGDPLTESPSHVKTKETTAIASKTLRCQIYRFPPILTDKISLKVMFMWRFCLS